MARPGKGQRYLEHGLMAGDTDRLAGVDVARGVAMLGMFVSHVGPDKGSAGSWLWVFDGRSSALFASLAGVGIGLLASRPGPPGMAMSLGGLRFRLAVRGMVVAVIGLLLLYLGTPVAVILPSYGVMFVLVLPLVGMPAPKLLAAGAIALTAGSLLVLALRQWVTGEAGATWPATAEALLFAWKYPALAWVGYVLTGMALGALLRDRPGGTARVMLLSGVAVAVASYGASALAGTLWAFDVESWPGVLLSPVPHSTSPLEMLGNAGVAAAVLASSMLLLPGHRAGPLAPVAAIGSMPLTIYTGHIIAIAALGDDVVRNPLSPLPLLGIMFGAAVFATVWRTAFGAGPLEQLVRLSAAGARRG
ncbi:heparan-alpha-glucosaminide N-acetyltransferase domain-containing protein [Lentzea sp. BCCO 10_0798]|uniref:Heparan-alpha-glucosaminide N-acetyltransferase domain-containing protein n=1 Tax=Lentzea kristufekii TaxID=3095430 RepID=A0ABU4TKK7_9PSEU|nr:heparan-alpha-glucosaminide N-acetyltransferase domain-containing protein [Lentzea sp. BCCO 10_0798]MDX8048477.1 heparan-alpha-glucosaminide N-acetyltransferase domain-containing protein [Lentzea sp. BCCO 10_0798]